MRNCQHQSLRRIGVDGFRPPRHEWYECRGCGQQLLVQLLASCPANQESREEQEAKAKGVKRGMIYYADDQTSWGSLQHAANRNQLLREVQEIESFLVPRPDALEEGEGYIQQDKTQVEEVRTRLMKLVARVHKRELLSSTTLEGLVESIVEDLNPLDEDPIYRVYHRLACIDEHSREWQTPALRENPEMGKQVALEQQVTKQPKEGRDEQRHGEGRREQ